MELGLTERAVQSRGQLQIQLVIRTVLEFKKQINFSAKLHKEYCKG